jgi:hypothetical protein
MAVTTLTPSSEIPAHDKVNVSYRDSLGMTTAMTNFSVLVSTTLAQLTTIASDIDLITSAKICDVKRNVITYSVDAGADAADAIGSYSEVSDFIRLKFVSASRCDADIYIDVPAPHYDATQTPPILNGEGLATVTTTHPAIMAFATHLTPYLTNPRKASFAGGPLSDYSFVSGHKGRLGKSANACGTTSKTSKKG